MVAQRAKLTLARLLCSAPLGWAISKVRHDRLPSRGLVIDSSRLSPSVKAMIVWGMYESAEARFVQTELRSDLPVIELGSSVGYVSCLIRRKLDPTQRLICVEPNVQLIPSIYENFRINHLDEQVTVVHAAISYYGETQLVLGPTNVDSRMVAAPLQASQKALSIQPITLSELIASHGLDEDYALVCDIEGAETGIVRCDAEALKRCQQIIIEMHECVVNGQSVTVASLATEFVALGFVKTKQYGPVMVLTR